MGLGQLLGQTFKTPEPRPVGTQAGVDIAGTKAPSIGAPETALQQLDGTTGEYYQKWGDLQAFATNMWTNFGVDVTKPDFRKPEAMEAHEIYRKALADLRYQGDKLKTGQKMLEMGYGASLKDANVTQAEGYDPSTDIAGAGSYVQSGMTDQERALDIAEREKTQQESIGGRQEDQQRFTAQQNRLRMEADAEQNRLRREADAEHDEKMVRLRAELAKGQYDDKYINAVETRVNTISDIANGEVEILDALTDGYGNQLFTDIQIDNQGGKLYLTTQNGVTRSYNMNSPRFAEQMNEVLDRSGDKIKWHQLKGFVKPEQAKPSPEYIKKRDALLTDRKALGKIEGIQDLFDRGAVRIPPTHVAADGNAISPMDEVFDLATERSGKKVVIKYTTGNNEEYRVEYSLNTDKGRREYKEFLDLNAEVLGLLPEEEVPNPTAVPEEATIDYEKVESIDDII